MWPLSTAAQNQLANTHAMTVRATAYTAAFGVVPDLPIASGSISVDATSQTRRTGTLGISHPDYWPEDPYAILSPLGSELGIEYGIELLGGRVEWVPVFRGPIVNVARVKPSSSGDAAVRVTVSDRSSKVAESRFEQPTQTAAGATTVTEIRRLITEVLPTVTVTDLTGSTKVAPQLDMERERWADGVEPLADSIGAECFADAIGNFTVRPQPLLTNTPVWVVASGDEGVLISLDEQRTRERTYNRIVASGQRTDGTPPVWTSVSDNDPTSPTYIGGPFGIKPRFYTSPLLTTTQHCTDAATALLARTTGMHGSVSLTTLVNPALDAGDILLVRDNGYLAAHIIDTVSIPLIPGDAQQISTRSLELPPES